MKPSDIIDRQPSAVPLCVDCNQPATMVDRPMPLCDRCARIILGPTEMLNLVTCGACKYAYNANEWDRCPNDDCTLNALPTPCCAICGNEDWNVAGTNLCEACYNDRNPDPEAWFDEQKGD